jgi:hypothetical protein
MVQALPQYSDQIDKLSLHVEVGCYVVRDIVQSLKISTCRLFFFLYEHKTMHVNVLALDFLSSLVFCGPTHQLLSTKELLKYMWIAHLLSISSDFLVLLIGA